MSGGSPPIPRDDQSRLIDAHAVPGCGEAKFPTVRANPITAAGELCREKAPSTTAARATTLRANSKQATVIALLSHPKGTTIDAIMQSNRLAGARNVI